MDVNLALAAATSVNARAASAVESAQLGLLKRVMDTQTNLNAKMLDSMTVPLATEGRVGTNVNLYA